MCLLRFFCCGRLHVHLGLYDRHSESFKPTSDLFGLYIYMFIDQGGSGLGGSLIMPDVKSEIFASIDSRTLDTTVIRGVQVTNLKSNLRSF